MKCLRLEGLFAGWYNLGIESHGMSIQVELIAYDPNDCRIRITWKDRGKTYQQYIPLIRTLTNLGEGYFRWFFTDYNRSLRFTKVYYDGNAFVSRIDLEDALYSNQTKSKNQQAFEFCFRKPLLLTNKIEVILKQPHLKTIYRGKPTRTMRRLDKLTTELRKYDLPI